MSWPNVEGGGRGKEVGRTEREEGMKGRDILILLTEVGFVLLYCAVKFKTLVRFIYNW